MRSYPVQHVFGDHLASAYQTGGHLMQARAAMEKALSWGNEPIFLRRDKTYWPCVGVARKLNAAVRDRPGPEDKKEAALHD